MTQTDVVQANVLYPNHGTEESPPKYSMKAPGKQLAELLGSTAHHRKEDSDLFLLPEGSAKSRSKASNINPHYNLTGFSKGISSDTGYNRRVNTFDITTQ